MTEGREAPQRHHVVFAVAPDRHALLIANQVVGLPKKGHARGLTIHPGSWHIEYGRGAVEFAKLIVRADTKGRKTSACRNLLPLLARELRPGRTPF